MKRVLVLGGAGFIGRYLISQLFDMFPSLFVYSIGRGELKAEREKHFHYSSSITLQKLEQCFGKDHNAVQFDVVFNCAGSGSVGLANKDPLSDFRDTICSLYETLEYLRRNVNSPSFVQLSSAAVYGNAENLPIKVGDKLKPISTYGYSNLMAEKAVELYSDVYGLKARTLRLFSVYGAGLKKQLLWDACRKLTLGDTKFFGTGSEVRDWIHVEDVVRQILWAALDMRTSQLTYAVYNSASGVGVEIRTVLDIIARRFELTGKKIEFNGESKVGDPLGYVAELALGTPKSEINLELGIMNYVDWFRGQ